MAILPILIAPHPTLKAKAKPVKEVTDGLRTLLDDMLETMYDAPGIGLAANQIGSLERVLGSIVHFSAVPHCACDGRIRSLLHD